MPSTQQSSVHGPIQRIHPEIAGMFADEMDIRSICRWRATCRDNYGQAVASLRRTLTNRLHAFVPYPHKIVDIVTKHGAVFSGELALSFILRPDAYRPSVLEIFASNFQFDKLYRDIVTEPNTRPHIKDHNPLPTTLFNTLRRHIAKTVVIHMTNGAIIYLHCSYTCSPSDPITRSSCTALTNFVTGYGFGCSHPSLTLCRRALQADQDLAYLLPHDVLIMDRLQAYNFSIALSPTAWPEYRSYMEGEDLRTTGRCWRTQYVCPKQGRFFGDRGSLVGFFDPLGGDEEQCIANNIAPFGPMVMWRLMSTFDCDEGCEYTDEVLEQGVTSIPVLFKKDPFGQLHECVSDRCMRSSPFYRTFARPRTLSA